MATQAMDWKSYSESTYTGNEGDDQEHLPVGVVVHMRQDHGEG